MREALPPVYVINLKRSTERRRFMEAQLESWPGEWTFVEAIDGAHLAACERAKVSQIRAFWHYGRFLHRNEIGCALSHHSVWERIYTQDIPEALVLEDDISLSSDLLGILIERVSWLPEDWGLVNFSHDIAKPIPLMEISHAPCVHLCRFDAVVGRAGAYLLRRNAAKNLVQAARKIYRVSDDHTGDESIIKSGLYGTIPRLADWNDDIPSDTWVEVTSTEHAQLSRAGLLGMGMRAVRRSARIFFRR